MAVTRKGRKSGGHLKVGDIVFHVAYPNNKDETGLCAVISIRRPTDTDTSIARLHILANGHYFDCFCESHLYSEDEGARLLLAGVRAGQDILILFGKDRSKHPYLGNKT